MEGLTDIDVPQTARSESLAKSQAFRATKADAQESQLYFVECSKSVSGTLRGAFRSPIVEALNTREMTVIFMSFTHGDILIALPGDGIAFTGPW